MENDNPLRNSAEGCFFCVFQNSNFLRFFVIFSEYIDLVYALVYDMRVESYRSRRGSLC